MTDRHSDAPRGMKRAIATNIRDLRKLKGLTQLELAQRIGVDVTAVAKIEAGRRSVSAEELWEIAAAMEVRVTDLYGYPGAAEDAMLTALVLTPERELTARLDGLATFTSGKGVGTLEELVARIHSGVETYSNKVQNPYELTASPHQVEQALVDAARYIDRQEDFSRDVLLALARLRGDAEPEISKGRRGNRLRARQVQNRGEAD